LVHGFVWRMTSRRTKISPKSGRGLGHVTSTIFGSTVGYPNDRLASCCIIVIRIINDNKTEWWPLFRVG